MKPNSVKFRCPECDVRIKASVQLVGRRHNCPACSQSFTVPPVIPEDAGPILVLLERADRFALSLAYRRGA